MSDQDYKETWNGFTKFVLWGTIAVAFSGGSLITQIIGAGSICIFVFVSSLLFWYILDVIMGIRSHLRVPSQSKKKLAQSGKRGLLKQFNTGYL